MKKLGVHYESIGRATITKPVETSSNGRLS